MRFAFDIEFDLDLLILAICSMFLTSKVMDCFCKEPQRKMREPPTVNLDEYKKENDDRR